MAGVQISAGIPAPVPAAPRLSAWALMGGVLSAAGLPIYIFAPTFYAETYGIPLTALGAMLFGLRLFDVVQDPALGWIAERLGPARGRAVAFASLMMALAMLALFAVPPLLPPLWWFGLSVCVLFTAFSFVSICFYAQGVATAGRDGQVRLAAWRETGALIGVCLAAIAPTLLGLWMEHPYAGFAWGFAVLTLVAVWAMARDWTGAASLGEAVPMRAILADGPARQLMILALVNSLPLAVSSTLFLWFVEARLGAPGQEGVLLLLFFLAAAIAAPFWTQLAGRIGARAALLIAMVLAVVAFAGTAFLGDGDIWWFAVISAISGATIGADLTLLPALFGARLAVISPNGGAGFGLWSLVNKFTLAFAAVTLLPLLEAQGFDPSAATQPESALVALGLLYAVLPCALKLLAIALLVFVRLKEE